MNTNIIPFHPKFEQAFISLYKEVFGGAPYFESFEDDEVREIIQKQNLFLLVKVKDQELLGFVAGIPLSCTGNKKQIWDLLDFPSEVNYICELGVCSKYRGQGLGYKLIAAYIRAHEQSKKKINSFALRTKKTNNEAAQNLYKKLGFRLLRDDFSHLPIELTVSHSRVNGEEETDVRVCYVRLVQARIRYLSRQKTQKYGLV